VYFSRRSFLRSAGAAAAFSVSPLHGMSLPLAASRPDPCFLRTGSAYAPFVERFVRYITPGADDFVAEKFAAELVAVLTSWQQAFTGPGSDLSKVHDLLLETLEASLLNRAEVTPLRTDQPVQSYKVVFSPAEKTSRQAFVDALHAYLEPLSTLEIAQLQLGSMEIPSGENTSTQQLVAKTKISYDLIGKIGTNQREERTGIWDVSWRKDTTGTWLITAWTAGDESRARLTGPGFTDISRIAFANVDSYQQQMSHGVDHWRTVLDGACGIDIYGNNGLAIGDFDGDGHDDLYVCQPAGLPNRLYRNRGDGTYVDVTDAAGVGLLDGTSAAVFADLTNSGRQDLIVVRHGGPLLFINLGNGKFELKPDAFHFARPVEGTFTGVAVADYNRDGLLDVYFCTYSFYQGLSDYGFPKPYYDAQNGPPNFLLKNVGGHAFEDVTAKAGLDVSNNRFSFAAVWNDYDRDGWLDLYVVNDFGRKVLYRNNRNGTFTDVSAECGVEDPGEGMSATWFDYDNDGYEDIYSVNMWEAAGRRVTKQSQFLPNAPENIRQVFFLDASGNSMLHNEGQGGKFRNVTRESGSQAGGWNWSSEAWDFDHDGYPDLYVANGFISGANTEDLSSFYWRHVAARSLDAGGQLKDYADAWSAINEFIRSDYTWSGYQRNNFYLNNRNATFCETAGLLGLDCVEDGRSFVLSDLDGDGRLEVILKNRTAPQIKVFRNDLNPIGESVAFSLRGTKSNRDAIGAVVELIGEHGRQRKTVRAGSGFLSQNTKLLYFGVGLTKGLLRAVIRWPNGEEQVLENVPLRNRIEVQETVAGFNATAFREFRGSSAAHEPPTAPLSPSNTAVWLLEPIVPPAFSLPDQHGASRSLADAKDHPQLLVFWGSGCEESHEYLLTLHGLLRKQPDALKVLSVRIAAQKEPPASWVNELIAQLTFPVLASDEKTAALYNIFHRYLFDRRQPMVSPTSFLIDRDGKVVRVYSGRVQSQRLLEDLDNVPETPEERLHVGLPFPGHYLRGALHHNYFTYGVAYLQYEFQDEALQAFEESIRNGESTGAVYYNVGLIYLNKGSADQARGNLEKAVELDPANADAWNNLGVVYGQLGDLTRAQSDFQKAIDLEPGHLLAIQNMVKLYRYQDRANDAQALLENAIAHDPNQAELHNGLAMLFVDGKNLGRATAEFEKAVRLAPGNVEMLNGLGVVLMESGASDQAMQRFEACRRLAPDYDRPYLNMAVLYVNAGHAEKAHALLSDYLARHPDNAQIRQALDELGNQK
jgi:Flp pilus assembly protein TadD/peroxiredoxin